MAIKARQRNHFQMLDKITDLVDNQRYIAASLMSLDVARKVVGIGSVVTRC